MGQVRTILLNKSVFADNDARAEILRADLRKDGVLLVNVMSSPGAGKTSTLTSLINSIKDKVKVAVMEADIDSDVDAQSIVKNTGVDSIQLHTGGMCHLDADMTREGLDAIDYKKYDIIFLENVGNLVCPAEYDTGATMDIMILSTSEGDDKPLKYPLIFQKCNLVIISKIDAIKYFTFDLDKCIDNITYRNKDVRVIPISNKTQEGIEELSTFFLDKIKNYKEI
ncbi:MAG: hydrogenase nickel incorporation protein HypB [Clostridiales bacterium]|nr:hydrogenase nickel incorporation protein HypB [Clostridiales bacterium]